MDKNTFQLIYKGKVAKETDIPLQEIDREIKDQEKGTNIVKVNEEGTALMQVRHEFVNVGESIGQIKRSTSAHATEHGTIKVVQFKQEIASRGEEVWYYKNSTGTFEGTLEEAKAVFPDVEFEGMNIPDPQFVDSPEHGRLSVMPSQPLKWETINEYDGEKEGGPTTWEKWADATQTALDVVGLIPGVGEVADGLNGVISLVRGDYAGAALSFAAMIPFVGAGATVAKQARKLKKLAKINQETTKGVYDLVVKNADEVNNYVGQSKNVFQRFIQHFNPKKGKLKHTILEEGSIIHKMKGSTKAEREMYEQFIILKKYGDDWKETGELLNKVNPVGGRYDLTTLQGRNQFLKEAEKIADKYNLPKEFEKGIKLN